MVAWRGYSTSSIIIPPEIVATPTISSRTPPNIKKNPVHCLGAYLDPVPNLVQIRLEMASLFEEKQTFEPIIIEVWMLVRTVCLIIVFLGR